MRTLTVSQDETLNSGACPVCGGTLFQHGPEGGLAENIRCARCGEEYWFSPPFIGEFMERRTSPKLVDRIYHGNFTIKDGQAIDL